MSTDGDLNRAGELFRYLCRHLVVSEPHIGLKPITSESDLGL